MGTEGTEDLRAQLEDYYGTAMPQYPMAAMDLARIEEMDDDEIVQEAEEVGIIRRR